MNFFLTITLFIIIAFANDCYYECDWAISDYIYRVCDVKSMYTENQPVNKACATSCIQNERQNLVQSGCFDSKEYYSYCNYWSFDCAYQCSFWTHCYRGHWNGGLGKKCYYSCPISEVPECIRNNCGNEWIACEENKKCITAVKEFAFIPNAICSADKLSGIDFKTCMEEEDHTCGADAVCDELFESLRGCVTQNECHIHDSNSTSVTYYQ
eukprot:UN06537